MQKTNPLEYQRDQHHVRLIVYHLIWYPRRGKAVLTGAIADRCRALIELKCQEKGWTILTLAIQPDHLRREFPALLKLPSMWTRLYFASTAGNISQATIQRYIDAQKGR
jgi:putative transposase